MSLEYLQDMLLLASDLKTLTMVYLYFFKRTPQFVDHVYGGQTVLSSADQYARGPTRATNYHSAIRQTPGMEDVFRAAACYGDASDAFYEIAESFVIAALGSWESPLFLKLSSRIRLPVVANRWQRTFGIGLNGHPSLNHFRGNKRIPLVRAGTYTVPHCNNTSCYQ